MISKPMEGREVRAERAVLEALEEPVDRAEVAAMGLRVGVV